MKKEIILSSDGSQTLRVPEMNETYHSIHGALNESRHVFIDKGISFINEESIHIFEVGFGTGLNVMTTLEWLLKHPTKKVIYDTVEAYPVPEELISQLNYGSLLKFENAPSIFQKIHESPWGEMKEINAHFSLRKINQKIQECTLEDNYYHCIYFDAFAPNKQEEMWSIEVLQQCYDVLKVGGRFVTYCAKGQLKRDLKQLGFRVEMVDGPPGKREMTTAIKE